MPTAPPENASKHVLKLGLESTAPEDAKKHVLTENSLTIFLIYASKNVLLIPFSMEILTHTFVYRNVLLLTTVLEIL
jgi:hypothetical protein